MAQFTVRRTRAFMCGGFAWTIWVEAQGHQLNEAGHLTAIDFDELWKWLGERLFPNVMLTGNGQIGYYHPREGAEQDLGAAVEADPAKYTAERLTAILLAEFRGISAAVVAVTVVRSSFSGVVDDTVEATVRAADADPVTKTEFVQGLRRMANLNGLRFSSLDEGPPTVAGVLDRHAGKSL